MSDTNLPEGQSLTEMSLVSLTEKLSSSGELARAKVILPSEDELKVTLVDINTIQRLDELKADESIFQNSLSVVVGALLGIIITVMTGDKPITTTNDKSLIIILILSLLALFFNYLRERVTKKTKFLKDKIFKEHDKIS